MTALVGVDRRGAFDVLTLDSPANRNALSLRMLGELLDGVRSSAAGDSRGLVLTHTGSVFCAGVDLRERRSLGDADSSHSQLLGELFIQLWSYPKPLLTVIDGAVRGGGMGLIGCSDFVLATPDSTFAYAEAKVGVAPALVMAVTLPSVPLRGLLPWLLSGAVFDVAEAASLGLVTAVAAESGAAAAADQLAALTAGAPNAQIEIKRLARTFQSIDITAAIATMTATSAELFRSPEAHEGMAAFAEKRAPAWATTPETH